MPVIFRSQPNPRTRATETRPRIILRAGGDGQNGTEKEFLWTFPFMIFPPNAGYDYCSFAAARHGRWRILFICRSTPRKMAQRQIFHRTAAFMMMKRKQLVSKYGTNIDY